MSKRSISSRFGLSNKLKQLESSWLGLGDQLEFSWLGLGDQFESSWLGLGDKREQHYVYTRLDLGCVLVMMRLFFINDKISFTNSFMVVLVR